MPDIGELFAHIIKQTEKIETKLAGIEAKIRINYTDISPGGRRPSPIQASSTTAPKESPANNVIENKDKLLKEILDSQQRKIDMDPVARKAEEERVKQRQMDMKSQILQAKMEHAPLEGGKGDLPTEPDIHQDS